MQKPVVACWYSIDFSASCCLRITLEGVTPETLGCEVGAWEGGREVSGGTHGGNVKNEERGMQRERDSGTEAGDRNWLGTNVALNWRDGSMMVECWIWGKRGGRLCFLILVDNTRPSAHSRVCRHTQMNTVVALMPLLIVSTEIKALTTREIC